MRKKPLLFLALFLVLSLLMPARNLLAASPLQGTDQVLQILLVLDVSGSMSTPVYTGLVPQDLLSLLLELDGITQDPEYLQLQDQIQEAENDQAVLEAKQNQTQAYQNLSEWIEDDQEASLQHIQGEIRARLEEAECETGSANLISTAGSSESIMSYLYKDCPTATNKWTLVEDLLDLVPYLNNRDYKDLKDEWLAANQEYEAALYISGYATFAARLETYKQETGMEEIQAEIDRLVIEYGIPSRLDLAKSAAVNLIDLSKLDLNRTGRESLIGLVTFSNQAMMEHILTQDHETLKPLITAMVPLQQTNIGDALSLGLNELDQNADPDQPMMLILLSDGHANVGLSSSEILAAIPAQARQNNVILCTAGFADLETEVDFPLLEGLADQTDGEYLFTNNGAELGSFFAACRENAAGKQLLNQISGVLPADQFQEISQVDLESNTCELTLTLNFLSGTPLIELTKPGGENLDPVSEGVDYQSQNQVQLLTVEYPEEGEWSIALSNDDQEGEAAVYSLVISTEPCLGNENPPESDSQEAASLPFLLTDRGFSFLIGGLIGVIVILGAGTVLLINYRQRRAN